MYWQSRTPQISITFQETDTTQKTMIIASQIPLGL